MNKLKSYRDLYHTSRVYQVIITIAFAFLTVLIFSLRVFDCYDYVSNQSWSSGQLSALFILNFNYAIERFFFFMPIVASVCGIFFVWLNRPRISAIAAGALSLTMLFSLFRFYNNGKTFARGPFSEGDTTTQVITVKVLHSYYFLWGSLLLLLVIVVLAIIKTKKGPRPQTAFKVKDASPVIISDAEEIKIFKDLLDQGVITKEEFEFKKKQILKL